MVNIRDKIGNLTSGQVLLLWFIWISFDFFILISYTCRSETNVNCSTTLMESNIPFNLLMFSIILASLIPMLVFNFTYQLLNKQSVKRKSSIIRFYHAMTFIVNEAIFLIIISTLIGGLIFVEIHIKSQWIVSILMLGSYLLYFFTSVIWSRCRFSVAYQEVISDWGKRDFEKYTRCIYSWIALYTILSLILILFYLFKNNCAQQNAIWLGYLVVLSSMWLISFAVLWIIPSDDYAPILKSIRILRLRE